MESWELQQLQGLPLEAKIIKTKLRIMEWYEHWNGDVYISFSGGKDSTVLLDIVRSVYPDIPAVYVDTGLEYPEVREFVKDIGNGFYYSAKNNDTLYSIAEDNNLTYEELVKHKFNEQYQSEWWLEHKDARPNKVWIFKENSGNVIWLKPKMNFKEVLEKYGYPVISKEVSLKIKSARSKPDGYAMQSFDRNSPKNIKQKQKYSFAKYKYLLDAPFKISHQCCDVMKKQPVKKYEKETKRYGFLGTMATESMNRNTQWIKYGCNAFDKDRPTSQPLSFWTEQDILQYITTKELQYSNAYGEIIENEGKLVTTKCDRTGCMFCLYGCHLEKEPNRFQRMKETHPKLYEYCINKLGCGEVLDYIGVKY